MCFNLQTTRSRHVLFVKALCILLRRTSPNPPRVQLDLYCEKGVSSDLKSSKCSRYMWNILMVLLWFVSSGVAAVIIGKIGDVPEL